MADPARIAAELIVSQRTAFALAADGVDHCILFTRIAVDVARQRGVRARALAVSVELRGDRDPSTPFLLGVEGHLPEDAPEDAWDGHLVAIFDGRLMVDLAIDSATNAELGIRPEPFVEAASPEFVVGGEIELPVEGGIARYRAHPERRDYRNLPAWEPGSPEQIATLADALLWHPDRGI
jgi:hypothetical protein